MGFFDSLFGKSQVNDLTQAAEQANAERQKHAREASGILDDSLESSINFLRPDIDAGNESLEVYRTAIGLNGPEAQAEYFATFQNDPGFEAEMAFAQKGLERGAAARGLLGSGENLHAVGRLNQLGQRSAFDSRLNRLRDLSVSGSGASTNAASLTHNTGTQKAGITTNLGNALANSHQALGNARADNRLTGFNNAVALGGTVAKAYGEFQ